MRVFRGVHTVRQNARLTVGGPGSSLVPCRALWRSRRIRRESPRGRGATARRWLATRRGRGQNHQSGPIQPGPDRLRLDTNADRIFKGPAALSRCVIVFPGKSAISPLPTKCTNGCLQQSLPENGRAAILPFHRECGQSACPNFLPYSVETVHPGRCCISQNATLFFRSASSLTQNQTFTPLLSPPNFRRWFIFANDRF